MTGERARGSRSPEADGGFEVRRRAGYRRRASSARILIGLVLALLLATAAAAQTGDPALRAELEAAYQRFLAAAASGDRVRLRETISGQSFSDASITLAAMGLEFDANMVRSFAADAPDLSSARLLDIRRGDGEAALVYVRDVRAPEGVPPQVAFTYIRFIDEAGTWKYDALLDLQENKFAPDGTPSAFDERWLPPEFAVR